MKRLTRAFLSASLVLAGPLVGCKGTRAPGAAAGSAAAMGDWPSWYDLSPFVDFAKTHAPKDTQAALAAASKLLREDKMQSADAELSRHAEGDGRHFVAVARANLAALHFTVCVRGIAWRLEDRKPDGAPTERKMDFSESARVAPGDISVEAMLTNLDDALASGIPALEIHARIARARVTAFASRCAPNPEVQTRAEQILENDLATLAASASLTPDLAFMWGGIQMSRYSSAAARPFLLQSREAGFNDPAVSYMLAIAALDAREFDNADKLAKEARVAFAAIKNTEQEAECVFLRGEIARARPDAMLAEKFYRAALKISPAHTAALLGLVSLTAEQDENRAAQLLHDELGRVFGTEALDHDTVEEAARSGETLVILASEPLLAQVVRDGLLLDVESDTDGTRRALRYFYAAALEAGLAEYEMASGHALMARDEFAASGVPSPLDIEAFLRQVDSSQ